MDNRTDREMVLGFRPEAALETRPNPRTGVAEYRVAYAPGPGARDAGTPWTWSEARAWAAACVRLGLWSGRRG